MNDFLADLYGTNEIIAGSDEQDFEKDAAANFLIKIAEEQGVDLSECSDDEIAELYTEVEGELQKQASGIDDEAQTKLAEADFLGRAMAHAYVAELDEIEKEAGRMGEAVSKGKEIAGKVLRAVKGKAQEQAGAMRSMGSSLKGAVKGTALTGEKYNRKTALQHALMAAKRGAPTLGAGAALTAATALGAAKGIKALKNKDKEKKSFDEQFEEAAIERANAMLEQAGLLDQEKVAEAQLEEALNERAAEMLIEAGYTFEE